VGGAAGNGLFCIITTEAHCAEIHGVWRGAGSHCTSTTCSPGDADNSGFVNMDDLVRVITTWGACPKADDCAADMNGTLTVDIDDLVYVLTHWS
jgi:hypothetical protein